MVDTPPTSSFLPFLPDWQADARLLCLQLKPFVGLREERQERGGCSSAGQSACLSPLPVCLLLLCLLLCLPAGRVAEAVSALAECEEDERG